MKAWARAELLEIMGKTAPSPAFFDSAPPQCCTQHLLLPNVQQIFKNISLKRHQIINLPGVPTMSQSSPASPIRTWQRQGLYSQSQ